MEICFLARLKKVQAVGVSLTPTLSRCIWRKGATTHPEPREGSVSLTSPVHRARPDLPFLGEGEV